MKKTKKILAMGLALVMAFSLATGCGNNSGGVSSGTANPGGSSAGENVESSKPIEVSFWNGWTGNDGNVLLEMVEEFNQKNPYGITIKMDINSQFQEKFAAACAANEGPDMILGVNSYKLTYPDYLIDMNEVFQATSLKEEDFVPSLMDACSMNDILYVLPFQFTSRYLYWNKDLFSAAGLDPETPPATYEEWAEFASKITDKDKNIYGSGLAYTNYFGNVQILQRMGGLFVTDDDNGGFTAHFEGNKGYEKFLSWFKGMVDNGDNPIEKDTDSMMQAGQIGITLSGAWLNAGLTEAGVNYGVGVLPDDELGPMNPSTVSGFSVTKFASEEAKKACFRFTEWWNEGFEDTETTGALRWSLDCGYPTYYIPIMDDERYVSSPILKAMTIDPDVDTTYMSSNDFSGTFPLATEVVDTMTQAVVVNNVDPTTALADAQKNAEKVIAESLK